MAHPTIRQLAAGPPSQTDGLSVELHSLSGTPAYIVVLWPPQPTTIDPHAPALAHLARALVRTLRCRADRVDHASAQRR